MRILVIPFEKIDIIKEIKTEVARILNVNVKVYPEIAKASARKRSGFLGMQLNAEDFIPVIAETIKNKSYGLGITIKDLYVPDLNFVFGLASPMQKSCVISLARLIDKNKNLYLERSVKEAVHELGHTLFSLNHCANARCVMHFSNCLADTDYKDKEFCEQCKLKISR